MCLSKRRSPRHPLPREEDIISRYDVEGNGNGKVASLTILSNAIEGETLTPIDENCL